MLNTTVGLLLLSTLFAGCSSDAGQPATPAPTWTEADSDRCWDAIAPYSEAADRFGGRLLSIRTDLDEPLPKRRKQLAEALASALAVNPGVSFPGQRAAVDAYRSVLTTAATAVADPLTEDDFQRLTSDLNSAQSNFRYAYDDECIAIDAWIRANVPQ